MSDCNLFSRGSGGKETVEPGAHGPGDDPDGNTAASTIIPTVDDAETLNAIQTMFDQLRTLCNKQVEPSSRTA